MNKLLKIILVFLCLYSQAGFCASWQLEVIMPDNETKTYYVPVGTEFKVPIKFKNNMVCKIKAEEVKITEFGTLYTKNMECEFGRHFIQFGTNNYKKEPAARNIGIDGYQLVLYKDHP